MELASQIKKYRNNLGISQEELAERLFVSRQTISNWENDKNYPDVHSLLLLSKEFGISLDELIKGDIEVMKREVNAKDVKKMNNWSYVMLIAMILEAVLVVPLFLELKWIGLGIWLVIALVGLYAGKQVEDVKKDNKLTTYKEILRFNAGETLTEIETIEEKAKSKYQRILYPIACGVIVAVLALISAGIYGLLKFYIF